MNKKPDILSAAPPSDPAPLASRFADWVYRSSQCPSHARTEDRTARQTRVDLGRVSHHEIDQFFRLEWTKRHLAEPEPSEWEIIFTESDASKGVHYIASRLTVGGSPVRCVPDVVLKHKSTGKVLIIERKTTYKEDADIPEAGWPNVEAQLWCYSWIDDWTDALDILLIGQLWRRYRNGLVLSRRHPSWKRSDLNHEMRCAGWFKRYGGKIDENER